MPRLFWEDYSENAFSPRDNILNKLKKWASGEDQPPPDPDCNQYLLKLIGPPGAGKTWIMRKFQETETDQGHMVFWLSVPNDLCEVNPSTNLLAYSEQKAFDWLEVIFTQADPWGVPVRRGLQDHDSCGHLC
jgi:hypothetical protein